MIYTIVTLKNQWFVPLIGILDECQHFLSVVALFQIIFLVGCGILLSHGICDTAIVVKITSLNEKS